MSRFIVLAIALCWSGQALAWGDEGHEIVALIAQTFLRPEVRQQVDALLAADPDTLTAPTIDAAATWADKYRDSNQDARTRTRQWHFADIEIAAPDLDRACFGHPPVPSGTLASNGPDQDCVVDKIEQFAAELGNPATGPGERIMALKFVLHLVGDLHQPLHVADDRDRGGNDKRISATGFKAGTLHHYWDTEFVEQLGPDPQRAAAALRQRISQQDIRAWSQGTPSDWALEAFKVAKDDAYGKLPTQNERRSYRLTDAYVAMAVQDAGTQLSRAGVRLAVILNGALGTKR